MSLIWKYDFRENSLIGVCISLWLKQSLRRGGWKRPVDASTICGGSGFRGRREPINISLCGRQAEYPGLVRGIYVRLKYGLVGNVQSEEQKLGFLRAAEVIITGKNQQLSSRCNFRPQGHALKVIHRNAGGEPVKIKQQIFLTGDKVARFQSVFFCGACGGGP